MRVGVEQDGDSGLRAVGRRSRAVAVAGPMRVVLGAWGPRLRCARRRPRGLGASLACQTHEPERSGRRLAPRRDVGPGGASMRVVRSSAWFQNTRSSRPARALAPPARPFRGGPVHRGRDARDHRVLARSASNAGESNPFTVPSDALSVVLGALCVPVRATVRSSGSCPRCRACRRGWPGPSARRRALAGRRSVGGCGRARRPLRPGCAPSVAPRNAGAGIGSRRLRAPGPDCR